MTYLELVNAVLRRLRETEVSSVSENAYSALIGDFINDSKSRIENSWDWSSLYTSLNFNTLESITEYYLTDSDLNLKTVDVINTTSSAFMEYRPSVWMDKAYLDTPDAVGAPTYYNFNGVNSAGNIIFNLYPKPDGVYSIKINGTIRTVDLSLDTDKLVVPFRPVIHAALALAARERGETGGTSTPEYFAMAEAYLSDAIALDANRNPENLIFREV